MYQVRKAVIPAAGLGTRFLPATKAQPKEMLPILDKPTIQYVVEEANAEFILKAQLIMFTSLGKIAHRDKNLPAQVFNQRFYAAVLVLHFIQIQDGFIIQLLVE